MNDILLPLAEFTFGFGCLIVMLRVISVERLLKRSIRDTCRFPLFSARDDLVRLVVDQKMRERDRVWADAYGAVIELLDESENMTLIGLMNRYIRLTVRLAASAELRSEYQAYQSLLRAAAKSVPEFDAALKAADRAIWGMCGRRTTRWQLHAYVVTLKGLARTIAFVRQGIAGARAISSVGWRASHFIAFDHRRALTC